VYNTTFAWTIYPFKSLLVPHLPNNEGFLRLFDVRAPLGSIVNARPPAAVNARHLLVNLLPGLIYEALAPALPERVPAHPGTLWTIVARRGRSERSQPFTMAMFFNGGTSASESGDGASCMSFPSNISVTPIEIVENLSPLRFQYKVLAPDSGGQGMWRGGCGQRIAIESISDEPVMVSLLTERTRFPAVGLKGGQPGACGFVKRNGHMIDEPKSIVTLSRGDVLEFQLPGGGGFGNPSCRSLPLRHKDFREGYTSQP
jgi:N-methylhydantoinase B